MSVGTAVVFAGACLLAKTRAAGALRPALHLLAMPPICTPALIDIARYFFVDAMTTIPAVVLLYSPDTKVASIAILNLDEAGEAGAAAAMACMIGVASVAVTLVIMAAGAWVGRRTQAWRHPATA